GGMLMTGYVRKLAEKAREASVTLATLDDAARAVLLQSMADAVDAGRADILSANARDLSRADANGTTGAMRDRLMLDDARLDGIVQAIRDVAALPDPVGQVTRTTTLENGLKVERVRVPPGLMAMLGGARPNAAAGAAAPCRRAGRAVLARRGSGARDSNTALAHRLRAALAEHGLAPEAVAPREDGARQHVRELLQLSERVDLAIP